MANEGDEREFESFVDALTGPLFRTALLLVGDRALAEDVLRLAFTKLYQRWHRVRGLAEPRAYALDVLVDRAWSRRHRWSNEVPLTALDADEPLEQVAAAALAWQGVLALPPRPRVVAVLRFHEDLTELQVAHVLGIAESTVRSSLHPADQTSSVWRDAAQKLAGAAVPPTMDLALVRTGARRVRRRRISLAAGVAIVVGTTTLLVARQGPAPAPPQPPPAIEEAPDPLVGLVDQAVWADSRRLHIGERQYAPAGTAIEQIALLWTGVVYTDGSGDVWLQPPAGRPQQIGDSALTLTLATSDDGVTAAWLERHRGETQLVTVDATALDQELRVSLKEDPLRQDGLRGDHVAAVSAIEYVTADEVVLRVDDARRRVRVDTRTGVSSEVTGAARDALDLTSGVVATAGGSDSPDQLRRTLAFLDRAGRVVARAGPLEAGGVFSQGGVWFLAVEQTSLGHAVRVVDPRTGETKHLTGDSARYPVVSWGYGRTALVHEVHLSDTSAPPNLWVCDARTSVCQRTNVDAGDDGAVVLPNP